jgi:hypothetical protein
MGKERERKGKGKGKERERKGKGKGKERNHRIDYREMCRVERRILK